MNRRHNSRKSIAEDDDEEDEEEPEDPIKASGLSKFADFLGPNPDALERNGSPEPELSFWDRMQRSLGGAGALWKVRWRKAREDWVGRDQFRWTAMTIGLLVFSRREKGKSVSRWTPLLDTTKFQTVRCDSTPFYNNQFFLFFLFIYLFLSILCLFTFTYKKKRWDSNSNFSLLLWN